MNEAQKFYLNTPGRDYAFTRRNVSFMEELSLIENIQTCAARIGMFPDSGVQIFQELENFMEKYTSQYGEYFLLPDDWIKMHREKYKINENQQIKLF
jgi:hypothetical protein